MLDTEKIIINAAFYEMYETVFGDDFFVILTQLRESPRVEALRKKANLTEEEQEEITNASIELGSKMRKLTPRIAYIGNKLYKKEFNGSYNDYVEFLSTCDASDFLNAEIIGKVWEKINLDQLTPKSVKNV